MKARGNYEPQPFEIEVTGKNALLKFYENVTEINEVDGENDSAFVGWEFDRYNIERPYDASLSARVQGGLPAWLEMAKSEERGRLAADVRSRRDALLKATDITQLADAPLDKNTKAAYKEYRQALRDVPQQEGFPYSVDFPVAPES